MYDAVKAVEDHLQSGFTYSERPPSREYPLEAFLFEDKIGYCQQFSGAMALMLRMSGIPARVVSGFSPGSLNRDTGEFRVRDLDAHSWVEVYFADIGWVTFDPTPAAAPADRAGQVTNNPLGDRPQPGEREQPAARTPRSPTAAPTRRPGAAGGAAAMAALPPDRDPARRRGGGARLRRLAAAPALARGRSRRQPARAGASAHRGWAGRFPPAPRCCSWSAGWPAWRARAPPATWPASARAATPRGAPAHPGAPPAAPFAASSPRRVGRSPASVASRRFRRAGPRFR